jgi:hypothetical protein
VRAFAWSSLIKLSCRILAIAQEDPTVLSKLNSYMRLITLLTRLFPSVSVDARQRLTADWSSRC